MSDNNTLDIHKLRGHQPEPIQPTPTAAPHEPEPLHHPGAAAAARERLAAIPDTHPMQHPDAIPAAPTTSLITDKQTLAQRQDLAPTTTRRKLPSAFAPLLTAVIIFGVVLALFKAPVIISQISYAMGQGNSQQAGTGETTNAHSVIPAENTISIPKINVHAPIQYIDSNQEVDIQKALQDGVVHYSTTALPGQPGNVAVFGHSSNDWWEPGNYKFVFVLLDKLVPGDQIIVDYSSVRYTYEVIGSKVVEPTAVDVLNPTAEPTLTVITCSPPGTSLKRLVVSAKQISPAPKSGGVVVSSPGSSANEQATLPSAAPGFAEQIGNFFGGLWSGLTSLLNGNSGSNGPKPTATTAGQ